MPVTVNKIQLWRTEVDNQPGVLAGILGPLASADLHIVMGYRFPGNETRSAVELFPVTTKKAKAAAQAAGLSPSTIPTLQVEGDNRPGLGFAITQALADAGINLAFLMAQVIGRKYSAILGLESDADATRSVPLIKKATAAKPKRATKRAAKKTR